MKGKKIEYGVQKNFSVFEDTMGEMTWQEYLSKMRMVIQHISI